MDYLKFQTSYEQYEDVLVMIGHFSKYAIAVPTRGQTAAITAKALYRNLFRIIGVPGAYNLIRGREF